MNTVNLHVRNLETNEIVHTVKVSHATERKVERVLSGLLRQTDTDRFYVDEEETS